MKDSTVTEEEMQKDDEKSVDEACMDYYLYQLLFGSDDKKKK